MSHFSLLPYPTSKIHCQIVVLHCPFCHQCQNHLCFCSYNISIETRPEKKITFWYFYNYVTRPIPKINLEVGVEKHSWCWVNPVKCGRILTFLVHYNLTLSNGATIGSNPRPKYFFSKPFLILKL